jgi:broad specificity phosphatase PhoE
MPGVILIRHAMPEVQPGVSSTLWRLGESALEDCVLLAHALPPALGSKVYASNQPKVTQTAGVIALRRGLDVVEDSRLREVEQDHTWIEDYRAAAMEYLEHGPHGESAGWEPHDRVVERFDAGIAEAVHANTEIAGGVLVVNHGLAMSLWLASRVPLDIVPWWKALTFPDAWRVDLDAGTAEHLWLGGREGA